MWFIYLFIYLLLYLYFYFLIHLSIYFSIYLLIYLSINLFNYSGLASAAQQHGRSVSENLFGRDDDYYDDDIDCNEKNKEEEEEFSDEVDEFFSNSGGNSDSTGVGLQGVDSDDTLFGAVTGAQTIDAPLTLWTLPEIASVGLTYAQANKLLPVQINNLNGNNVPRLIEGRGYFKDMARGRLSGEYIIIFVYHIIFSHVTI